MPGAERRVRAARFAPLAAVLTITAAVLVRDPHQHGTWGVCPTYALIGVYCPGCGTLRALHDLGTGQWAESVGHNALVIPAVAFFAYAALRTPDRAWAWCWLGAVIAFAVLRNLPGSPLAA